MNSYKEKSPKFIENRSLKNISVWFLKPKILKSPGNQQMKWSDLSVNEMVNFQEDLILSFPPKRLHS